MIMEYVLLILLFTLVNSQVRNLPEYEIDSLHDLFKSCNGENWYWASKNTPYSKWDFDRQYVNPCIEKWKGVTCENSTTDESVAYVTQLYLPEMNLTGTLPPSLGNLSELDSFTAFSNHIEGQIPKDLLLLSKLYYLDVENNSISGTFPDQMSPSIAYLVLNMNNLSGSLSSNIGTLKSLLSLEVGNNFLTGTLPPSLSNCSQLMIVYLNSNFLNGTIPAEYGSLTKVDGISLDDNYLTGPIPEELMNACNEYFYGLSLAFNRLNGTVPASLNNCSTMQQLYLNNNQFYGTIPNLLVEFGIVVDLSHNNLTGTIPTLKFKSIGLGYNHLNGSIPSYFLDGSLGTVTLNNNELTGSLVVQLDQYLRLTYIDVSHNLLTGTIPNELFQVEYLSFLDFGHNYFHGTLSEDFASFRGLETLRLNNNQFYGTLPDIFVNLTILSAFNGASNQFTGSIPSFLMENDMEGFEVNGNLLEDEIPSQLLGCYKMLILNLGNNFLTGTIPSQYIGNMKFLSGFNLYNNLLSGQLPYSVNQLSSLQLLFLDMNMLSGNLALLFDGTTQKVLKYVDVSNNQIHGTLPSSPFQVPSLLSFAAVSNCLYGSLPTADICALSNLTTLALDGIISASVCQYIYFPEIPWIYHAYDVWRYVDGGLDECLFNMPKLSTLHLSGNAMPGSLPKDLIISDVLVDLSLSHNALTGTIPESIQYHRWMNLDLSYNKFTGGLSHSLPEPADNSSLSLEVNRLSGVIPHSLKYAADIDILDGNLWKCSVDRSQLPVHDKNSAIYECGSNSFNYALYVWLCIVVLVICLKVGLWQCYRNSRWLKSLQVLSDECLSVFQDDKDRIGEDGNLISFGAFSKNIRRLLSFLSVVILVVLMPIYIALSLTNNTYAYEYAWTVSAGFLSGLTPAVVLFVCFILLGMFCIALLLRFIKYTPIIASSQSVFSFPVGLLCSFLLIVILNVVFVLIMNIVYVYVHVTYDSTTVHLAQVALAVFKLVWNNWAVRELLKLTKRFERGGNTRVGVEVFMILFNNLGAPFIATAFVSTNCFYNVVAAPPKVEVSYVYSACLESEYFINGSSCITYDNAQVVSASYEPPFLYSYQCASTFITTYATIYVFMFIITAFLAPVGLALLNYVYLTTDENSTLHSLVEMFIPKILMLPNSNMSALVEKTVEADTKKIFHCDLYVVKVINIFAMMLTFGAVMPPLALVGLVAVVSFTYYSQLLIGRFVVKAGGGVEDRRLAMVSMNRDCEHAADMFMNAVWIVAPYTMAFYALLLLDTLGDTEGWRRALWAPVSMLVIPVGLWLLFKFQALLVGRNNPRKRGSSSIEESVLDEAFSENLLGGDVADRSLDSRL